MKLFFTSLLLSSLKTIMDSNYNNVPDGVRPALSESKVTKDLSRKAYLTKNICDRNFKDDADFKEKYFSA